MSYTDTFSGGVLGGNWSTCGGGVFGTLDVAGGEVRAFGDPCANIYSAGTFANDQYSQVVLGTVLTGTGDGIGPLVRGSTANEAMYYTSASNTDSVLNKVTVTATWTQLGSTNTSDNATGDLFYISAVGNVVTVKKNGANHIGPVTDSSAPVGPTTGKAGIFGSDEGGSVFPTGDNWEGGDITSGATAAPAAGLLTITGSLPVAVKSGQSTRDIPGASLLLTGSQVTATRFAVALPISEVTDGAWIPGVGGGADLFAQLDDESDSDYDYTLSNSTMEVKFAPINDPEVSSGHSVAYRIKGTGANVITVRLMQGAGQIAAWTHNPAPASLTSYEQVLSAGEANSITDYTDLRLRVITS